MCQKLLLLLLLLQVCVNKTAALLVERSTCVAKLLVLQHDFRLLSRVYGSTSGTMYTGTRITALPLC